MQKFKLLVMSIGILGVSAVATAGQHENEDGAQNTHTHKTKHKRKFAEHRLNKVDTNQDGKVDLNEYLAHAEQRFNKMDSNSDGYLTLEEGQKNHKEMRRKHKEMKQRHKAERQALREEIRSEKSTSD